MNAISNNRWNQLLYPQQASGVQKNGQQQGTQQVQETDLYALINPQNQPQQTQQVQDPNKTQRLEPTSKTSEVSPGALSLAELQGRMQLQTTQAAENGPGMTDTQKIQQDVNKVKESVQGKLKLAGEAHALRMPDQAVGQLKSAFTDVMSFQKGLEQQYGDEFKNSPQLAPIKAQLDKMAGSIAERAAGVIQSTGASSNKQDVLDILKDGYNKKNPQPGQMTNGNQSAQARTGLQLKAESMITAAEASARPEASQDAASKGVTELRGAKAISTLLEDFGTNNSLAERIQHVEAAHKKQANPFAQAA